MSKKSEERQSNKLAYFWYLQDTADHVDPYVKNFFETKFSTTTELQTILMNQYRFWKPQLRPAQVRLAYELVWGKNRKDTIPACASVEIKDTGYYCYDDVLDIGKDPKLTLIWGMYIVLSHIIAQDLLHNFNTTQVQQVLKELFELDKNNMQWTIIDWQLRKQANKELYMEKADRYNFWEHVLKIWWVLWGANETEVNKLWYIGKKIGTAYIIANDTWDFGKNLEDFRSWKYTLPIIKAFEETTEKDKNILLSLFGKNILSEKDIYIIREIVVKSHAIDFWKTKAQEFCNEWIEILHDFDDSHARKMLEFATTMTQKNKYYNILKTYE